MQNAKLNIWIAKKRSSGTKEHRNKFGVSVQKLLEDKLLLKKEKGKIIPEWMNSLLKEYEDIFKEIITEDSPDASIGVLDPTAQHKIPLIDGAIPVKMRSYAISAALDVIHYLYMHPQRRYTRCHRVPRH